MTYIVAALTAVKALCDWGMEVLLDSASGFLVYAIVVLAILIYIEKRKKQEAPERERGERIREEVPKEATSRNSGKGEIFSSIKRIISKAVNSFRNRESDDEEGFSEIGKSRVAEEPDFEEPEAEKAGEVAEAEPVAEAEKDDETAAGTVDDKEDLFTDI